MASQGSGSVLRAQQARGLSEATVRVLQAGLMGGGEKLRKAHISCSYKALTTKKKKMQEGKENLGYKKTEEEGCMLSSNYARHRPASHGSHLYCYAHFMPRKLNRQKAGNSPKSQRLESNRTPKSPQFDHSGPEPTRGRFYRTCSAISLFVGWGGSLGIFNCLVHTPCQLFLKIRRRWKNCLWDSSM